MENKKLIKILLKDFADVDEMISENENGNFSPLEMEFLTSRIKGARKLLQMLSDSFLQNEKSDEKVIEHALETVVNTPVKENVIVNQPHKEPAQVVEKPAIQVIVEEHVAEIKKEDTLIEAIPLQAQVFSVNQNKTEEHKVDTEIPTQNVPEREQIKPEKQQRLGDTFTKERSVNELLTDQNKLEFKLSNLPVANIQNAIGINDKFLFIRELFDGDAEKFNSTVIILDNMKEITQAVDYLQQNFKWKKNDASLKFVNLVKRRFPV